MPYYDAQPFDIQATFIAQTLNGQAKYAPPAGSCIVVTRVQWNSARGATTFGLFALKKGPLAADVFWNADMAAGNAVPYVWPKGYALPEATALLWDVYDQGAVTINGFVCKTPVWP